MSPRLRLLLALVGIALIVVSLAALAYALWPAESVRNQLPLDPTLFVPPGSAVPWPRFG